MALTARNRKFAELYALNFLPAYKCYQIAYDKPDLDKMTAYKRASDIYHRSEVKSEIERLREDFFIQNNINGQYIANKLIDIIESPEASIADKNKSIDLLSKNLGLQTQKIEAKTDQVIDIKVGYDNGTES